MARATSEDKYRTIIDTAVTIFAENGFWNTPTSRIASAAGIASGTLFLYFATKDALISQVYLDIKRELAAVLLGELPTDAPVEAQMRHIWQRYLAWALAYPQRFSVLHQIGGSNTLPDEVKAQANEPFLAVEALARQSIDQGIFYDYPVDYIAAIFNSHAISTVEAMTVSATPEVDYVRIGFDMFWRGLTR